MRLAGINVHPVKSTAIRPVETAYVGVHGLAGDREWMVVDTAGMLVTARDTPRLFHVVADNAATGLDDLDGADLRLSAPGLDPLDVRIPTQPGAEVGVRFFGGTVRARPAGEAADAWLRRALGSDDLRLVWCHEPEARVVEGPGLEDGRHHAVFQDDSPVSLLSDASVAALNGWTGEEIPARRFRANLLVDGAPTAFAEDGWSVLTIGGARLRVVVPIARCSMTTIDPDTLTTGKEPIRTLARHRKWSGQTWFAVHLVVEQPGEIAVGDELVLG
ncbi:MOSC domain-containing protein [Nocardioides cheoyonin]|uniref:MOSC domain-containing protein n=1 Tax=Nocardioides cheoyonin TaxID=3156615 RepID=UPI0032B40681